MRSARLLRLYFVLVVLAWAWPARAQSPPAVIVDNGVPKMIDGVFGLGAHAQRQGYLSVESITKDESAKFRQHTASTILVVAPVIDDGDFRVSARLRLVRLDASAKPSWLCFKIGTHYYDFEVNDTSIRYIGRMIDSVTYEPAMQSSAVTLPADDRPVSIEISRQGSLVTLTIDSQTVATCKVVQFLHGDLALEVTSPEAERTLIETANGRTDLRIYEFRATGTIAPRSQPEQDWRQRILPEYRHVRRIGNAMGYVPDDPRLPKVLLIGDSISLYYTDPVRGILAGKANVHRIPDNARMTSYGLEQLPKWLNNEKWDVIHFNFGLHDITRTSPEDYEKNLEQIVRILEGTGAHLIWATTTPVPKETTLITPEKVQNFNAIAKRVMDRHHIPIDNVHVWMAPHSDEYKLFPGNEHFNSAGSAYLAKQVARSISETLGRIEEKTN